MFLKMIMKKWNKWLRYWKGWTYQWKVGRNNRLKPERNNNYHDFKCHGKVRNIREKSFNDFGIALIDGKITPKQAKKKNQSKSYYIHIWLK